MTRTLSTLILALALSPVGAAWAHGGEAHDHGAPAPIVTTSAASLSRAAASEKFELVLTLDAATAGQDRHAHLYLSDYATNAPVSGATLSVEWGPDLVTPVTATKQPGVYEATVRFPAAGEYAPLVTVSADGHDDLLTLDAIPVPPPASAPVNRGLLALGGGALLLAGGAAFWLRRPKPSQANRHAEVQP